MVPTVVTAVLNIVHRLTLKEKLRFGGFIYLLLQVERGKEENHRRSQPQSPPFPRSACKQRQSQPPKHYGLFWPEAMDKSKILDTTMTIYHSQRPLKLTYISDVWF
jgi:hypothetical protein